MWQLYLSCVLLLSIFGLPLLGTWLSGQSILPYLALPPRTTEVQPGEVSWPLFFFATISIALVSTPFLIRLLTFPHQPLKVKNQQHFPGWGWIALASLILFWIIAWNRFAWVASYQLHTFTPLWLSHIVLINALTKMRTGRCLLVNQPRIYFSLFPLSAGIWWVFEYLNRFVHNWYYLPIKEFDSLTYFLLGSLSFSTVLPALYSTHELLRSFQKLTAPFAIWWKLRVLNERLWGWVLLTTAGVGLMSIGIWPTLVYPLIWMGPLLLLLGLQILQKRKSILGKIQEGDWRPVVTPALAGLTCGFFWELWNVQSLAQWKYAIPYLQVLPIFEMPLLGYAGYIPFGIECIVIIHLLIPGLKNNEENR